MKSQVLHTVWCSYYVCGGAAGEIYIDRSLLGVKGLSHLCGLVFTLVNFSNNTGAGDDRFITATVSWDVQLRNHCLGQRSRQVSPCNPGSNFHFRVQSAMNALSVAMT